MARETFEILDGVRRAKSYELLGKPAIPAEVIDENGHTVARRDVPVDSLRVTTKRSIDVSTQKEWERFYENVQRGEGRFAHAANPGHARRGKANDSRDSTRPNR